MSLVDLINTTDELPDATPEAAAAQRIDAALVKLAHHAAAAVRCLDTRRLYHDDITAAIAADVDGIRRASTSTRARPTASPTFTSAQSTSADARTTIQCGRAFAAWPSTATAT